MISWCDVLARSASAANDIAANIVSYLVCWNFSLGFYHMIQKLQKLYVYYFGELIYVASADNAHTSISTSRFLQSPNASRYIPRDFWQLFPGAAAVGGFSVRLRGGAPADTETAVAAVLEALQGRQLVLRVVDIGAGDISGEQPQHLLVCFPSKIVYQWLQFYQPK